MIVGGQQINQKYEVLSLNNETNYRCRSHKSVPIDDLAVGTFINGKAIVCSSQNQRGKCFWFDNSTGNWINGPKMSSTSLYNQAATSFTDSLWFVTGSSAGDHRYTALFQASDNTFNESYASLPTNMYYHMMVPVNATHVISLGGSSNTRNIWIFNRITNTWKTLPSLPSAKSYALAGMANFNEVVVTGGYRNQATYILSLKTLTWRTGSNLDLPIQRGAVVPFENTFLIVGGHYYNGKTDVDVNTIRQYDPDTGKWIIRKERLQTATEYVAAFLVPESYIKCD